MSLFAPVSDALLAPITDCYGMGWEAHDQARTALDDHVFHLAPTGTETAASDSLAHPIGPVPA